jgi:hypothetical protein
MIVNIMPTTKARNRISNRYFIGIGLFSIVDEFLEASPAKGSSFIGKQFVRCGTFAVGAFHHKCLNLLLPLNTIEAWVV